MSRLAREHPDDPEMWANPPVHADVRARCADPRCGRRVSWDGAFCAEHDEAPPIPARFDERYDPSPEPIERRIS